MFKKMLSRFGLIPPAHPLFADNWHYFRRLDQNRPLSDYEFVVFDTELTGLNRRQDEIVSIGAVKVRHLQIMVGETFHVYVKPSRPLPKNSTLIHRITPQQIDQAPRLAEVLPDFISFCGQALLVGHYVGLDVAFLNRACRRHYGAPVSNPCLDTMRLAQTYTEMQWQQYHDRFRMDVAYNLAALGREYGLPDFTLHDAYEDALQTAYLFVFLIKQMRSKGIVTLRDIFSAGQAWRNLF
ncbi:3'-5' exonuclease [Desulfurivibrio dismutans]|uniref:3'-5' exonuclease n=1 Tax=Desulfurivibrio dismutans TaxID=1398908 RepID=UPI0023DAE298|nr:3'-5' exonuclease [Desulfurivibrio alkaliphilus]MDF1614884.1 3'-5' exonuclease [Desulfurivibrio alkaliphilus]